MASKVGALFVAFGLDDSQYQAGLASATRSAQKSTTLIQANFSTLNFRTFLYGMAGVYAVKHAIEGTMSPAIKFESQLAQVSTQLSKSAMGIMPVYKAQLEDMAKTYGQSTEVLSRGLYDILSATVSPVEAMKLLDVANKAATAGMTDTATATSALISVLKSYGMEVGRASSISDVLFASVLRGRQTFEQMASGIGVVASSAAQSKLPFEALAALISTITRAGVPVEMSFIAIANMLNKFVDASPEAKDVAKSLGFELSTAALQGDGLVKVMRGLSRATTEQVNVMFPEMRGLRGVNAALADSNGLMEDFKLMHQAAGMTMEAFNKQTGATEYQLKQLGQVLLLDVLMPFTSALLPAIKNAVGAMRTWIAANKDVVSIKLSEWAALSMKAIQSLFEFILRWHKPIVLAMELMFGIAIYKKIEAVGLAMSKLVGFLVGISALRVPALVALTGLPNVVTGLAALAIGGAVYLGVKGIWDSLRKTSELKFDNVTSVIDTVASTKTNGDSLTRHLDNMQKLSEYATAAAQSGKSVGSAWNAVYESFAKVSQGGRPLSAIERDVMSMYGVDTASLRKAFVAAYNTAKDAAGKVVTTASAKPGKTQEEWEAEAKAFEEYQSRMRDMLFAQIDFDNTLKEQAYEDELERQKTLAEDTLKLTRDTEMEKTNLIKSGVDRNIAQIELEKQWYLEDLKARYAGTVGYMQAVTTANAYYAALIKNAQAEAADEATRAWQAFQDHFSHVLVRMVGEGKLSARKIANAFWETIKRITVELAALRVTSALFNFIAPGGGDVYRFLDKIGAFATGGMVYKPSLALVGESGPERILNPSETQRYNQSTSDDHSSVEIHIHTDANGLATMNPYKFAQMYKEAKRSQLLKDA